MRRIQVNFTDQQYKIIAKFKGTLGNRDTEVCKNLIMAYLNEKGYIRAAVLKK